MDQEIKEWLDNTDRDYNKGVDLLETWGNNACLVRNYRNRSARFAMKSLEADLRRLSRQLGDSPMLRSKSKTKAEEPEIIQRAKLKLHELWVQLSRDTDALYELGESNDDTMVAARAALLAGRPALAKQHDLLYEMKEEFFQLGRINPDLQAALDGKDKEEPKESGLEEMGTVKLTKMVHAIKQNIKRNSNLLRYQQPTATKALNAMPASPKRKEIEKQIETKRKELEAAELELSRRE